ncbi:hypothetical protein OSTOST_16784, partial [Ostertagia ostertagi]
GNLPGKYYLQQFHLHWGDNDNIGSENTVDGRHYSAEVHFVHFMEGLHNMSEAAKTPHGIA